MKELLNYNEKGPNGRDTGVKVIVKLPESDPISSDVKKLLAAQNRMIYVLQNINRDEAPMTFVTEFKKAQEEIERLYEKLKL